MADEPRKALGVLGMFLHAASLVWKGDGRDLDRAWRRVYGEDMPECLLTVRFYPGRRCVISRRDRTVEIRKVPGELGSTVVERAAESVKGGVRDLIDAFIR